MANFFECVYKCVNKIPRGQVATYGQIAALIGSPRAARQVGWALHQLPADTTIPWHRVINRFGEISTTCDTHTAELQKILLQKEGVRTTKRKDGLWWINLEKYQWTTP
ncbi:MAG: MGMT family protein [Candidatus Komeilibacteria bacterium]|nr:MGMT family protein [Candidatus Komeilibacteria bacterium]